jgi:gamma-glutamyl:cysteine ligase YbdK (ATP-grasp superfamily)
MPLDVYPDPTGRYQKITRDMPREVLTAACRIIGTHVHIGMPDHETALRVYNRLCPYFEHLCEMGNGSFGERLAIYRQMAPKYKPTPYESWEDFYGSACKKGFVEDPRKCWTLIRISVHGTIEFRMFGATDNHERIVRWATKCHELCMEAAA